MTRFAFFRSSERLGSGCDRVLGAWHCLDYHISAFAYARRGLSSGLPPHAAAVCQYVCSLFVFLEPPIGVLVARTFRPLLGSASPKWRFGLLKPSPDRVPHMTHREDHFQHSSVLRVPTAGAAAHAAHGGAYHNTSAAALFYACLLSTLSLSCPWG